MRKKDEVYMIKYKSNDNPYYRIVNCNFRFEESAMKKADELKQNKNISEIIVNKRVGYRSVKIYSCSNGFEVHYLNRRMG